MSGFVYTQCLKQNFLIMIQILDSIKEKLGRLCMDKKTLTMSKATEDKEKIFTVSAQIKLNL